MPHGSAARRRNWAQAAKAKVAARKAKKRAEKQAMMENQHRQLTIPVVTEDDLLSFQLSHFGDDTKPETFFVDPEQALNYQPDFEYLNDDGLGWYDDGVKRTLTDEQIAMFRHSEMEQLKRARLIQAENQAAEEEENEDEDDDVDDDEYEPPEVVTCDLPDQVPQSPVSDVSSLEDELCANPTRAEFKPPKSHPHPKKKRPSRSSRSESTHFSRALSPRSRQREAEIPYDQRNKRKWEDFIDAQDPFHGAMTHRRMVRELDQHRESSVVMDYGDDEPAPPPPPPPPPAKLPTPIPGRRIISYEDD